MCKHTVSKEEGQGHTQTHAHLSREPVSRPSRFFSLSELGSGGAQGQGLCHATGRGVGIYITQL